MIDVEPRRQALTQEVGLGERRLPALAVLTVGHAQADVLAAAEKVRLGVGELGHDALRRRIAAAEADRAGRLVLDLDHHDDAVGRRARTVRNVDLLEVAEAVQPALGPLDHLVVVGVAFADVELAANDVVARPCVADDVDPLDVDFRTVVDRVAQRDRVVRRVAVAMRAHFREGVAVACDVAAHGVDRLVDPAGVVDVARAQSGEPQQRRPVNGRDVRVHVHARDVVLRPLVERDRDDVAGRVLPGRRRRC